MRKESSSSIGGGGVGVLGLLGVAFVVLKLMGYIDWSWWWVTAPFWGGFALVLGLLATAAAGVGVVTGIAALWALLKKKKA